MMGGGESYTALEASLLPEEAAASARRQWEKTYLDVLGVCCSAEVALVERLLAPLDGVRAVSVVVPSRTVVVEHDPAAVSQSRIVKVLNGAGLEASVRAYGSSGVIGRWPSPYIVACGALLLASSFRWLLPPLQWLALGAACAGAPPMLLRGVAAASRLTLDINILMLIAVVGAVALKDYTEAGVIVFLFTTAEWLETLACTKASAGMSSLMSMIPPKAVLAETGEVVNVRDIDVGAVIAVRAGEMVPVDGVVVDGQSEVDERSLTGESYPVPKQPHSEVWAGTLNLDGYIAVRTSALAENSTVAKMERLVEEAQQSKSKTQRLIDSCARYYTPAVVVLGAGVALLPPLLGARDAERWFRLALVLLVSACPCALVLSTPVATFCALLTAARMGLLVKGGDVLESLGEIKAVAFDKTGTITRGEFTIDMFDVVGHKVQMSHLLYWISSIESKSSHPMAAALVEHAQSKSIEPKPECVAEFRILPGEGIYGEIDGKRIYVGNKRVLARASSCQTDFVAYSIRNARKKEWSERRLDRLRDLRRGPRRGVLALRRLPDRRGRSDSRAVIHGHQLSTAHGGQRGGGRAHAGAPGRRPGGAPLGALPGGQGPAGECGEGQGWTDDDGRRRHERRPGASDGGRGRLHGHLRLGRGHGNQPRDAHVQRHPQGPRGHQARQARPPDHRRQHGVLGRRQGRRPRSRARLAPGAVGGGPRRRGDVPARRAQQHAAAGGGGRTPRGGGGVPRHGKVAGDEKDSARRRFTGRCH